MLLGTPDHIVTSCSSPFAGGRRSTLWSVELASVGELRHTTGDTRQQRGRWGEREEADVRMMTSPPL